MKTVPYFAECKVEEPPKVPQLTSLIQPDYFYKLVKDPDDLSPKVVDSSEEDKDDTET